MLFANQCASTSTNIFKIIESNENIMGNVNKLTHADSIRLLNLVLNCYSNNNKKALPKIARQKALPFLWHNKFYQIYSINSVDSTFIQRIFFAFFVCGHVLLFFWYIQCFVWNELLLSTQFHFIVNLKIKQNQSKNNIW